MRSLTVAFTLGFAIAAQASPFAIEARDNMVAPGWTPPPPPPGGKNLTGQLTPDEIMAKYPNGTSHTKRDGDLVERASGCGQGRCPDTDPPFRSDAPWDLLFQFFVFYIPSPFGDPIPYFTQEYHLRINDCGECQSNSVGTVGIQPGEDGCYEFTSCNRAQTICIDDGHHRAHRQWHDTQDKECYALNVNGKDACGPWKSTTIWSPTEPVPCDW